MTAALPTGRRGQALAWALLAVLLVAAWASVATPLLEWHADRAEALQRRMSLAQRMTQVAAGLPELQRQAAMVATAGPMAATLLDGASDAVAGATLQQRIQDIAARAGATLASAEALPAEPVAAYRRIAVRVAVSVPWPVLVEVLRAVADGPPYMLVDDLQVRGGRQFGTGELPLEASFVVLGFRAP